MQAIERLPLRKNAMILMTTTMSTKHMKTHTETQLGTWNMTAAVATICTAVHCTVRMYNKQNKQGSCSPLTVLYKHNQKHLNSNQGTQPLIAQVHHTNPLQPPHQQYLAGAYPPPVPTCLCPGGHSNSVPSALLSTRHNKGRPFVSSATAPFFRECNTSHTAF